MEAPPQLSEDGRHYWDGARWLAVTEDGTHSVVDDQPLPLPWWAVRGVSIQAMIGGMYLGGHPAHPKPIKRAVFQLTNHGVAVVVGRGNGIVFEPWVAVQDFVLEGPDEFRRRASAGRLLGFGLLGYITASGKYSYITVHTAGGVIAFETPTAMKHELKPLLHDVLKHYPQRGAAGTDERLSVAVPVDPYEQLTKLASLRDRGIISPDDFEAKKKELLSRL